jgi:hypothetical protein
MKVSSHQGEYQRILKNLASLSKPHYGLSPLAMSNLTNRLIRLRQFKHAIERTCGGERFAPYVPGELLWKKPKQKEQVHKLGFFAVIFAWIRKFFQSGKRG